MDTAMAKADVFATPWPGIHATRIDSARHYPRHSHATYGFGVIERGAQRSASGRGQVDAHAGDVITNNPGEVHDGKPIGDGGRLWRMLHLEPAMFAATLGDTDADRASLRRSLRTRRARSRCRDAGGASADSGDPVPRRGCATPGWD